jgi:hypothetical protein
VILLERSKKNSLVRKPKIKIKPLKMNKDLRQKEWMEVKERPQRRI